MPAISRLALAFAVCERLQLVENATGYLGQVGRALPGAIGSPPGPLAKSPTDPRVQPYFIVWPGAGGPGPEVDLAELGEDLEITVRITAAGGDALDVLALADRIDAVLYRWTPTVPEATCGPLRPPTGYSPDLAFDTNVQPERAFVPLQYRLFVHA